MGKQVVVQGREDDWYEKAVFLLKQEPPKGRMNLVSEANHIIGAYMKTKPVDQLERVASPLDKKNTNWIDVLFYVSLILLGIMLVIYLI
ncbi:MAG: hypothetical protein ACRCW2_11260 [Cellulosilyticaceae bacterium]